MSVDSKDALWLQGTRRNTRSSSNQEKEAKEKSSNCTEESKKDQKDDSKKRDINSMSHIVRGEHNEVVAYTAEDDVSYKLFDSAYIATERSDNPYFIATIQEIKVSKKDNAVVVVKWYYRPGEVPDSVYQMLVKERLNGADDQQEKEMILNNECRNRELFLADDEITDMFPVSHLRGKCSVKHFNDFHQVKNYNLKPDTFFYILGYNPETRRLTSTQGEVRVGPSHQWNASTRGIFQKAVVPDLLPPMSPCTKQVNTEHEELMWKPRTNDCDLIMYLHSARSMAAFAGMCDGGSTEEGCVIASRDETTINALNVLFQSKGDTRAALQVLVKNPLPLTIERKWTEDQVKRFQKGLRQNGKNFFKIRKDLLPSKDTSELVEFYYLWKKVQDGLMVQPQSKNRRQASLKRNSKQANATSEGGEGSSSDIISDSEESDKDNGTFRCKHCYTTKSEDWNLGGKESVMLCTKCRIFFKKYGGDNQLDIDFDHDTPSDVEEVSQGTPIFDKVASDIQRFMFKPIKSTEDHKPDVTDAGDSGGETQDIKPCKRQWDVKDGASSSDEKIVEKRCKTEVQDAEMMDKSDEGVPDVPKWPKKEQTPIANVKSEDGARALPVKPIYPLNAAGILPPGFTPYAQYPNTYPGSIGQMHSSNERSQGKDASNYEENKAARPDGSPVKVGPSQSDKDRNERRSFPPQFPSQSTPFYPFVKPDHSHDDVMGSYPRTSAQSSQAEKNGQTDTSTRDAEAEKYGNGSVQRDLPIPADEKVPGGFSSNTQQYEQTTRPHPKYEGMRRPDTHEGGIQRREDSQNSGSERTADLPKLPQSHATRIPTAGSTDEGGRISPKPTDDEQSSDEYIHDILPSHHVTIPAGQPWPEQFRFYDDGLPCRNSKATSDYIYSKTRLRGFTHKLCSRTDLVWIPNPEPRAKQENPIAGAPSTSGLHRPQSHQPQHQPRTQQTPLPSRHASTEKDREATKAKSREVKTPTTGDSHQVKREPNRSQPMPRSTPVHAVPHHRSTPIHTPTYDAHRPTPSHASPYGGFGVDTPASRTLRQYASIDSQREAYIAMVAPDQNVHPLFAQSDRDLRERELRERELRERMPKQSIDAKLLSLDPQMAMAMSSNVMHSLMNQQQQQHALEQAHHPQFPGMLFGVPGANPHVPGFPPFLPQPTELQLQQSAAERIHADRVALEQQYRMELLHNHQHSHVHSHLHLHPSNAGGAAAATPAVLPPSASAEYMMALQAQQQAIAAGLDPLHAAASMGHPMLNLGGIRGHPGTPMMPPGLQIVHPGMAAVRPGENALQHYLSASATQQLQAVHEQSMQQSILEQQRLQEEYFRLAGLGGHK